MSDTVFLKDGEKAGFLTGWEIYKAALAPIAILAGFPLVWRVAN